MKDIEINIKYREIISDLRDFKDKVGYCLVEDKDESSDMVDYFNFMDTNPSLKEEVIWLLRKDEASIKKILMNVNNDERKKIGCAILEKIVYLYEILF